MTKILLIEDNASLRRNIAQFLQFDGYNVVSAENGRAGMECIRLEKPDLIICDIMMPGLDGYEVLAQIRSEASLASIPFIFLTAKGGMSELRIGMALGADDYLPKPVARLDLLDAVRTRLQRHAQQSTFVPCFDSAEPLEKLGISPREAEVLLWMAQGKANGDIAVICDISLGTVKKHANHIFEKLGVEGRTAATLRALEALSENGQRR
jgi:DNA-binding NarL/FixJ family response regulator